MGPTKTLGFAIRAATDIAKGTELRELAGLMPKDGRAKHSEVSCIRPSSEHNQSSRVQRILFGPIRFLNHICDNPNAEVQFKLYYKIKKLIMIQFVAISGSSGFFAVTAQDIAAGEELLIDYGKEWFADEPGGCPCRTCKPGQQVQKRQFEEKDEATVAAEKADARKAKRRRKKDKKLARNVGEAGPSDIH